MENQVLSFEEMKKMFLDEWVLLGSLNYTDIDILSGVVVMRHKDKGYIVSNRPNWRDNFSTTTIVFTGIFPKNGIFYENIQIYNH